MAVDLHKKGGNLECHLPWFTGVSGLNMGVGRITTDVTLNIIGLGLVVFNFEMN